MLSAQFDESKRTIIPLSKILGFGENNCRIDKSFIANFANFFDSSNKDQYHNRAAGMLDYSVEEIITKLIDSFAEEQIQYLIRDYLELERSLEEYQKCIKDESRRSIMDQKACKAKEKYEGDLMFYISRNNQLCSSQKRQ